MVAVLRVAVAVLLVAGPVAAFFEWRSRLRFPGPLPVQLDVTEETVVVPRPGQTFVSGTVTGATVTGSATVTLPVTFPAGGRATMHGVVVDGREAVVAWDGGRPLVLEGTGTIDPSPAGVTLTPGRVEWQLSGADLRGSFRTTAPVAVGREGLATPRDGVAFEAGEGSTIAASTPMTHEPRAVSVAGPGRADMVGTLMLRTTAGERVATRLRSEDGPFELRFTPAPGGYQVEGVIQAATVVE